MEDRHSSKPDSSSASQKIPAYIHAFHESISVTQRQYDVEQVTNTQHFIEPEGSYIFMEPTIYPILSQINPVHAPSPFYFLKIHK
jgi:hypothetical protein